jgi:uncharacterized protein with FMN-binding domain
MRRAVVVLGTTAAGLAALFSYKSHVAGVAVASTAPATPRVTATPVTRAPTHSVTPSPPASPTKKATPRPSPTKTTPPATHSAAPVVTPTPHPTTPKPTPTKTAPSGTFTGPAENTQYGEVQVQITVSNGKITNADGSLPQGGDSIAQNAISQLNPEVLSAQSANIQSVSGATYTSQGYIGSLQQAVNEAGLLSPGGPPPYPRCPGRYLSRPGGG